MSCTHEYIGMMTMRLTKRISYHVQEGAIYNHFKDAHRQTDNLNRDTLINGIKIIDSNEAPKRLHYLEAMHIPEKKH